MSRITPETLRALSERGSDAGAFELMETPIVEEMAAGLIEAAAALEKAQSKIKRVLVDAPHDDECFALSGSDDEAQICTCWKKILLQETPDSSL